MHSPGMLIYQERIRRNWSQQGLCKGICTVSYLSKIEASGCNKSLSISVLNQIANVLDVEITEFFKEDITI